MAAQGRNDARTAARLLASTAEECLNDPARAPANAVVLNNVYRLLEAYRVNAFFGLEPAASYYPAAETLSLIPPLEQYVSVVRDVLEHAVTATFVGQPKDEAITLIEDVLKRIAYPEFGTPSDAEKNKVTQFFSAVVQHL